MGRYSLGLIRGTTQKRLAGIARTATASGDAFRLRGIRRLGYTATFVDCLRNVQGMQHKFQPIENWPREGESGLAGSTHNKEKKVNSRMLTPARLGCHTKMLRAAAVASACLFATVVAWAQGTPAAGTSVSSKVGVIDVRAAIVGTAEGKQASAELQSQFASRQTELENLNKQVNDLRQRLQASQGKLSPDEEARLTQQGQRFTQQLERKQTEYQEDVNAAQGEVIDRIGRKLVDVLDRYSRENGYVLMIDSSAQNSPILYKSTQIDVTQDIVRLYDQAYPVKAAAAAPAQSKPVPKPAAQQQAPPAAQKPQQ
jgi:outer membrane protein